MIATHSPCQTREFMIAFTSVKIMLPAAPSINGLGIVLIYLLRNSMQNAIKQLCGVHWFSPHTKMCKWIKQLNSIERTNELQWTAVTRESIKVLSSWIVFFSIVTFFFSKKKKQQQRNRTVNHNRNSATNMNSCPLNCPFSLPLYLDPTPHPGQKEIKEVSAMMSLANCWLPMKETWPDTARREHS